MTICREWSLVKTQPEKRLAKSLFCRSWSCDVCRPKRKAQLLALCASGRPNRLLTLTVNPSVGTDPESRLLALSNAWRILVKRLRRQHGASAINYLAVVERTKQGEPHLHILLRSPFIPQSWLSAAMEGLIGAPIVDIRLIRQARKAVRYVAKYVTKDPHQFAGAKRYWHSTQYELDNDYSPPPKVPGESPWRVVMLNLFQIAEAWSFEGWWGRPSQDGSMQGVYLGLERLFRSIGEPL